MKRIVSCVSLAAVICAAVSFADVGMVSAQQPPPPEILGSYPVAGAESLYDCTDVGGGVDPELTNPVTAVLSITSQDGAAFSGNLGYPEQGAYLFYISGQISDQGLIEGTWTYAFDIPGELPLSEQVFSGEIADGRAAIELTATFGEDDVFCHYRVSLSTGAVTLSWSPPDTSSPDPLPPPRALVAIPGVPGAARDGSAAKASSPRDGRLTGYNVYRSTSPNVQPAPENLFTSVPPTQTSVPAADGAIGSFFVVTATYEDGESDPSNEVSGGIPAATLTDVNLRGAKIVAKGKDFSGRVQVFVDGIPFQSSARARNGVKVVQKGALRTGQTILQYITPGKTVAITFRNENGGVATWVYTGR